MYSYSYSYCGSGERCGPRASCYLYNILFMNNCVCVDWGGGVTLQAYSMLRPFDDVIYCTYCTLLQKPSSPLSHLLYTSVKKISVWRR